MQSMKLQPIPPKAQATEELQATWNSDPVGQNWDRIYTQSGLRSPDPVSGFVCVSHTKVATWLEVLLYLNVRALTKERPRTRPCGDVIGAATLLVPGKVW